MGFYINPSRRGPAVPRGSGKGVFPAWAGVAGPGPPAGPWRDPGTPGPRDPLREPRGPGARGWCKTPPAGRSRGPPGTPVLVSQPLRGLPGTPGTPIPGSRDRVPDPLPGSGGLQEAPEGPPGRPGRPAGGCFTSTPRGGAPRFPPGFPGSPGTPRSVESLQAAAALERAL